MFGQNDPENTKPTSLFPARNLFPFNTIKIILPHINGCTIIKNGTALPPDSMVPTAGVQALCLARIGKHFHESTYTSNEMV